MWFQVRREVRIKNVIFFIGYKEITKFILQIKSQIGRNFSTQNVEPRHCKITFDACSRIFMVRPGIALLILESQTHRAAGKLSPRRCRPNNVYLATFSAIKAM
jgi:hypothetical protein